LSLFFFPYLSVPPYFPPSGFFLSPLFSPSANIRREICVPPPYRTDLSLCQNLSVLESVSSLRLKNVLHAPTPSGGRRLQLPSRSSRCSTLWYLSFYMTIFPFSAKPLEMISPPRETFATRFDFRLLLITSPSSGLPYSPPRRHLILPPTYLLLTASKDFFTCLFPSYSIFCALVGSTFPPICSWRILMLSTLFFPLYAL